MAKKKMHINLLGDPDEVEITFINNVNGKLVVEEFVKKQIVEQMVSYLAARIARLENDGCKDPSVSGNAINTAVLNRCKKPIYEEIERVFGWLQ